MTRAWVCPIAYQVKWGGAYAPDMQNSLPKYIVDCSEIIIIIIIKKFFNFGIIRVIYISSYSSYKGLKTDALCLFRAPFKLFKNGDYIVLCKAENNDSAYDIQRSLRYGW